MATVSSAKYADFLRISGSANLLDPTPLRFPNQRSEKVMGRRAWWLIAANFFIPGSAQVLAGSRKLGRFGLVTTLVLWFGLVLLAGTFLVARPVFIALFTQSWVLLLLQLVILFYFVVWLVLTFDTLRLVRIIKLRVWARYAVSIVAILGLVFAGSMMTWAANSVGALRNVVEEVFTNSGPPVEPSDGYYNILLLGADSGDGRDSMRFDSISVISIEAETGALTIFGIPRDLPAPPFAPGPMNDLYPNGLEAHSDPECGWGSGINQLTNAVDVCWEGEPLYPDAEENGSTAAVEATKDAVSGVLGIEITYYVFIDMQGFADLIDALGGVDVNVLERLPKGWGPAPGTDQPAEEWAIGWIEAGQQHVDGDTAQWYARSRYTTSDYDRMRRQRELQQAIISQFTPSTVLARFQHILGAGANMIDTDIPLSMTSYFLDIAELSRQLPVTAVELTDENGIDPLEPNYADIRALVSRTLYPPLPSPSPSVSVRGD